MKMIEHYYNKISHERQLILTKVARDLASGAHSVRVSFPENEYGQGEGDSKYVIGDNIPTIEACSQTDECADVCL